MSPDRFDPGLLPGLSACCFETGTPQPVAETMASALDFSKFMIPAIDTMNESENYNASSATFSYGALGQADYASKKHSLRKIYDYRSTPSTLPAAKHGDYLTPPAKFEFESQIDWKNVFYNISTEEMHDVEAQGGTFNGNKNASVPFSCIYPAKKSQKSSRKQNFQPLNHMRSPEDLLKERCKSIFDLKIRGSSPLKDCTSRDAVSSRKHPVYPEKASVYELAKRRLYFKAQEASVMNFNADCTYQLQTNASTFAATTAPISRHPASPASPPNQKQTTASMRDKRIKSIANLFMVKTKQKVKKVPEISSDWKDRFSKEYKQLDIPSMTFLQIKDFAKKYSIDTHGRKNVIIERLVQVASDLERGIDSRETVNPNQSLQSPEAASNNNKSDLNGKESATLMPKSVDTNCTTLVDDSDEAFYNFLFK